LQRNGPGRFQGIWFGGSSCDDATSYLYTSREYEINGSLVADIEGKFTLSLITADVIQSAEAEKTIRILSRVNPDTGHMRLKSWFHAYREMSEQMNLALDGMAK
jgi:hypothetical protein